MKERYPILTAPVVVELYDRLSFLMWQYGVVPNAHLTIAWEQMGVHDHAKAARLLTLFNHEVGKWLKVGVKIGQTKKRIPERARTPSSQHFYIYVHENGRDQGFHTHELAFIPPEKAAAFHEWAPRCLARLTGQGSIQPEAFVARIKRGQGDDDRVARCWAWFRYITKSLCEGQLLQLGDGQLIDARAIFKSYHFILKPPVHCAQLASGSHNIGMKAQRAARFRSRFLDDSQLDYLYDGSELDAHRRTTEADELDASITPMLNLLDI